MNWSTESLPTLPVLDAATGGSRVHVVSGSFGAGHDSAAREIAARLVEAGHQVRIWDVVDLFPARIGTMVRAAYLRQLAISPGSWGALLSQLQPGRLAHRAASRALRLPGQRLLEIDRSGADLFVSTHPFASQALGQLRSDGRLATPVVTYLTDMSVHPLWVHPSVDLHLALHEVAADQARSWGGRVRVVEPLTPRSAPPGPGTNALRRELGLAPGEAVALVVGGSLGIGELEESANDVLSSGVARPVVLCGTNEALRQRLSRRDGVVALGWRDDVEALLGVADCVVQNSGGFMSLQALAAGVPIVSHRPLPGHGVSNAAALEQAGLARWSHHAADLADALIQVLETPRTTHVLLTTALPSDAPSFLDVLTVPATVLVGA